MRNRVEKGFINWTEASLIGQGLINGSRLNELALIKEHDNNGKSCPLDPAWIPVAGDE